MTALPITSDYDAPVSPIFGTIRTGTDASQTPLIQFLNPATSPVDLWLYELHPGLYSPGASSFEIRMRLTRNPISLAGTINGPGSAVHLDTYQAATHIYGALYGASDVSGHVIPDVSLWPIVYKIGPSGHPTWRIRRPGRRPLRIVPGHAFELHAPLTFGAGDLLRLNVVWDERAHVDSGPTGGIYVP